MTDFVIGLLLLAFAAGMAVLLPLGIAAYVNHQRYYDRTTRGRYRC